MDQGFRSRDNGCIALLYILRGANNILSTTMASTNNDFDDAIARSTQLTHVLYVDHAGHPAPLSLCFHATASRRLASLVDRHPPTMVVEVDSAYCPQCLSFYDTAAAAQMGVCTKASCGKLCPVCQSLATVAVDDDDGDDTEAVSSLCFYRCGLCDWTSRRCGLQVPCQIDKGDVTSKANLDIVERASEELAAQLKARIEQNDAASEEHYKTMLQSLQCMAKDRVKGQRSTTTPTMSTLMMPKRSLDGGGPQAWSVQSLEENMESRIKLTEASLEETIGGQELQVISLEAEQVPDASLQGLLPEALLLQPASSRLPSSSMDTILPLGVPLRARKSRRDRAELAQGRPGILLKPKLNPLEGDSSLRTGHGNWWKKDSSAMEVLPRARVLLHGSDGTRHAFLLKVSNPTLGAVHLRLAGSSYQGETMWNDPFTTNPLLENVLVDPLTQISIDARLHADLASDLQPTDTCQLESAEDSFIEIGKKALDVPEPVAKWNASEILANVKGPAPSLRLAGQQKSMAWFELVLMEPTTIAATAEEGRITEPKELHCAVPLSLQVQVGGGSWESSLIQPQFTEDGGKDFVSFDLIVTWQKVME